MAWQETHAAYVRQLRARKAADADFAEVFRAYARQVVRRSREKFNADPIKRADLLTKKRLYAALFRAEIKKDPAALERSSVGLRQTMAVLADTMAALRSQPLLPATAQRLREVSVLLGQQREGVLRLAAATDRQAATLLPPAADKSTYTQALGGLGGRRLSGTAAPRIYRTAG